jgi:NAD(P)H-hydrate epimerase
MSSDQFISESGLLIPSVDEQQMREVDRIAVEDFGLSILQMMENAGRNLAKNIIDLVDNKPSKVITVVAGTGGNGGGGLCSARHLHNHGYQISIILTRAAEDFRGAAGDQLEIIQKSGIAPQVPGNAKEVIEKSDITIDALIGYSLKGAPQGIHAEYIELINQHTKMVIALDLPSGVNATTGETPGVFVKADRTLTLALPKSGLKNPAAGEIYLADIGIPPEVFHPLGINIPPIFSDQYYYRLLPAN